MDEMMSRPLLAFFLLFLSPDPLPPSLFNPPASNSPTPPGVGCVGLLPICGCGHGVGLPALSDAVALSLPLVRCFPLNRYRVCLSVFPFCRPIE